MAPNRRRERPSRDGAIRVRASIRMGHAQGAPSHRMDLNTSPARAHKTRTHEPSRIDVQASASLARAHCHGMSALCRAETRTACYPNGVNVSKPTELGTILVACNVILSRERPPPLASWPRYAVPGAGREQTGSKTLTQEAITSSGSLRSEIREICETPLGFPNRPKTWVFTNRG